MLQPLPRPPTRYPNLQHDIYTLPANPPFRISSSAEDKTINSQARARMDGGERNR
jgi:hypothetical protein